MSMQAQGPRPVVDGAPAGTHAGALPALVLLPGLDGTGTLFQPLQAALGPAVDTIVVRYPGDATLGYSELQRVAHAALPADRPFMLLGESFSGPIAIRLAASNPPGLRGLILAVSFASNPHPLLGWMRRLMPASSRSSARNGMRYFMMLGRERPPALMPLIDQSQAALDGGVIRKRVVEMLGVEARADLARVAVPVLSLRARRDRLVPAANGRVIRAVARDVREVEIDGPHMLLQVRATEAAGHIRRFLDEAGGVPGAG